MHPPHCREFRLNCTFTADNYRAIRAQSLADWGGKMNSRRRKHKIWTSLNGTVTPVLFQRLESTMFINQYIFPNTFVSWSIKYCNKVKRTDLTTTSNSCGTTHGVVNCSVRHLVLLASSPAVSLLFYWSVSSRNLAIVDATTHKYGHS